METIIAMRTFLSKRLYLKRIVMGFAAFAFLGSSLVFAQQKPPIKIGFTMPQTGGLAANGKAALLAMQMWKDDINAKGGLLGRKVEFVFYDDQTNPSLVTGFYSKLLDADKVDIILGSYGTNMQVPPLPMVMQRKLYYVCLFGLDPNARFNYSGYFQMQPNGPNPAVDNTGTFLEAAMLANPKPKTIAIVGGDAEYPAVAMEGGRKNAKLLGLKVVYDNTYPPTTTDFAPIMRAIAATKPDIVMVNSYPPDTVGMIRAAYEVGLKAQVFGGPMPAACLYASQDFVQKNPNTCQAMANAIVQALKWLQTAGPSDIIKTVPENYLLGDRALYLASFGKIREALSLDGIMSSDAPPTALKAITSFEPDIRADKIDLSKTFTNNFALRAKERFKV